MNYAQSKLDGLLFEMMCLRLVCLKQDKIFILIGFTHKRCPRVAGFTEMHCTDIPCRTFTLNLVLV